MKGLVVTGGASGIGAAIAQAAHQAGFRVGILDVDAAAAEHLASALEPAIALTGDVTDATSIADALERFGDLDVLVNNAGILRTGALLEHSIEDFRQVIDTNLTGVFVTSQAGARAMLERGGVIINMSSINAAQPSPNAGAYVAAKAGLEALTRQMSLEWASHDIRVNAIAPGFVDAGMSTPFYQDAKIRQQRANAVPLGRLGSAEDIAQAVMFLTSDQAQYITGHTLTVDGGVSHSVLQQLPRQ